MKAVETRIDAAQWLTHGTLAGDFVGVRGSAARSLLGDFDAAALTSAASPIACAEDVDRAGLFDELLVRNRALGVHGDVLERIREAATGGARVVVTGQQPGVLGGPLMLLYKCATAVALAADIEQRTGTRCLPLYWLGADDDDFAEIRDLVLPTQDLAVAASTIGRGAHEVGTPVGDIGVDAVRRVWESMAPLLASAPGATAVGELVARALTEKDHGAAAARVVVSLFAGKIAVVDGRSAWLRRAARTLILRYFDSEESVRSDIAARGIELEKHGYHAQIQMGLDSGVFLLKQGRRRKIPPAQRESAREELRDDVERASPGVILRTLLQDSLFHPAAVVLGPAEIAYRAQITGVYRRFDIHRPIVFPRMSATWIPGAVAAIVEEAGVDPGLAVDETAFLRAIEATQRDENAARAGERFMEEVEGNRVRFLESVRGGLDEREREKLARRLADAERRLRDVVASADDGGAARAQLRWPVSAHIPELLGRRGARQERFMWMLSPFLHCGGDSTEAIIGMAARHVAATMDGAPAHTVYSLQP